MDKWGNSTPTKTTDTLAPDPDAIRQHIAMLIRPAIGRYDDALFEIAVDLGQGPNTARLFGLNEVDEAIAFVVSENVKRRNVYIGASLKTPDAPRMQRSSAQHFYVATAVPADIDDNYDAVMQEMVGKVGHAALTVITGTTPTRRSQHWFALLNPCEDGLEYAEAFAGLVQGIGADVKVKDAARIMRLGGTVSWPNERKLARGYKDELTRVQINQSVKPIAIERFIALEPVAVSWASHGKDPTGANFDGEIVQDGFGKIVDGRELWFRNYVYFLLCQYQQEHGADPTAEDLFEPAYKEFQRRCANPHEWPPAALMKRTRNTIRRLLQDQLPMKSVAGGNWKPEQGAHYTAWAEPFIEDAPKITSDSKIEGLKASEPEPPPHIMEWPEWKASYRAPKFLVKGILQYGYVYTLTARPGHGKSAVALFLAFCIALGNEFAGHRCRKGRVMFCAGENAPDINVRSHILCEVLGIEDEELTISVIPKTFGLKTQYEFIKAYADKMGGYDLIIIDTMQAFFPFEEENSNTEMVKYAEQQIRPLTELPGNPCVLVLAHPNKTASKDDLIPRGGSGFLGAIDGNLTLWKDGDTKILELKPHAEKFRGAPFDPISFELMQEESSHLKDGDGDPVSSVYPKPISEKDVERKEAQEASNEDKVLLAMHHWRRKFKADASSYDLEKNLGLSRRNISRIQFKLAGARPKLVERLTDKSPFRLTKKGEERVAELITKQRDDFEIDA